jgi:N-acyl-D-aspartate/D-glutamate deacylase
MLCRLQSDIPAQLTFEQHKSSAHLAIAFPICIIIIIIAIMVSSSMLLKNGTFLIHDGKSHVVPTLTDLLIENGKIVQIADNIEAPENAVVLDCTDKIISPGFIDTHHHGWQTQLKGRHANEQLMRYMVTGNCGSLSKRSMLTM